MEFKKFEKIFDDYVNKYIEKAKEEKNEAKILNLTNKKIHSYKVRDNILKIATLENLKVNMFIVEFIGLFHDIGRFYQYDKYETFNDSKSEDHAKLSVKVLEDEGIIKLIDYEDRPYVIDAILMHNRKDLPRDLDKKMYLYSALIRDADKLDGFRTITVYERDNKNLAYFKNKSDEPTISDEIYNNIINHKSVCKDNLETVLECQITTVGYITSDINFNATLRLVKENNYVDKMFEMIQETDQSKRIYNFVNEYIENRLNSTNKK